MQTTSCRGGPRAPVVLAHDDIREDPTMPVGRLAENQRRYVAVNSNPRLAVWDSHLLRCWRYGERNRPSRRSN